VEAVRGPIADRLRGQEWRSLEEIDAALIDLDGTPGKARLGANAIAGVSMACARALAGADGRELWDWLTPHQVTPQLPVPHFNLIDGGVHARDGPAAGCRARHDMGSTYRDQLRGTGGRPGRRVCRGRRPG
jgi:enolase